MEYDSRVSGAMTGAASKLVNLDVGEEENQDDGPVSSFDPVTLEVEQEASSCRSE